MIVSTGDSTVFVTDPEPSKCPSCGKEENKIEVCGHCGHKYKPTQLRWYEIIGLIIVVLFITAIIFMILVWLFPATGNPSLIDVIEESFKWITSKHLY